MRLIQISSPRSRATVAPHLGGRIAQFSIMRHDAWLDLLYTPEAQPEQLDPM